MARLLVTCVGRPIQCRYATTLFIGQRRQNGMIDLFRGGDVTRFKQ